MLKKLMAFATTTALLGANAAAYALNTARAAVRTVTGPAAAGDGEKNAAPADGRTVLPTIPRMTESAPPKTPSRATSSSHRPSSQKANRVKARGQKSQRKKSTRRAS